MKKFLFISNGFGENTIAGQVIDRLQLAVGVEIFGWPMVGAENFRRRRAKSPPSCGFGTMSLKLFIEDLRAGWISTHWRRVQSARQCAGNTI